jgi:hypothetical protein
LRTRWTASRVMLGSLGLNVCPPRSLKGRDHGGWRHRKMTSEPATGNRGCRCSGDMDGGEPLRPRQPATRPPAGADPRLCGPHGRDGSACERRSAHRMFMNVYVISVTPPSGPVFARSFFGQPAPNLQQRRRLAYTPTGGSRLEHPEYEPEFLTHDAKPGRVRVGSVFGIAPPGAVDKSCRQSDTRTSALDNSALFTAATSTSRSAGV